ncbi:MAG TPA: hypothetical protein VEA99_05540 [Gemmatimonadaceae bacterium]|nr:hypothetical protein [Gemmatimonadaceae bacterium]
MAREIPPGRHECTRDESLRDEHDDREDRDTPREDEANPPRTTTGKLTAPKFGSAGSGGAELEPGPKKN